MTKKLENESRLLTDVELELMTILWRIGEGSVNDVMKDLPKERELAYTSVSTVMRILEQKGVLSTRKEGRGHIYMPVLAKADYESRSLKHMVDRVFDGAPIAMMGALVRHLSDSGKLDEKQIAEMKSLLTKASGRK